MQAHPLSSPAAWNINVHSSTPLSRRPPAVPPSLLKVAGLAHDAGNLLGALGLYCDLLDAPRSPSPRAPALRARARASSRSARRALISRLLQTGPAPSLLQPHHASQSAQARCCATSTPLLLLARRARSPTCAVEDTSRPALPPLPFVAETLRTHPRQPHPQRGHRLRRSRAGDLPVRPAIILIGLHQPGEERNRCNMGPRAHHRRHRAVACSPCTAASLSSNRSPLPPGSTRGLGHRIVHELLQSDAAATSASARGAPGRSTTIRHRVAPAPPPRLRTDRRSSSHREAAAC